MGPKKNKRKNEDDDQQFMKKEKSVQEMLKKVQHKKKNKQHDSDQSEQQQINTKKKQIFDWQLSKEKQKALQQAQQRKQKQLKQKQQKQLQEKILSPQQQRQLQIKLEKQKKEKEKKDKKKQQKKIERLKVVQEDKIEEQKRKQQDQRQAEQVQRQVKKPQSNGKSLPIFFLVFILALFALQYQREIYTRLSKFKLDETQNYYETFEIDSGATDKQLKQKYKRLVLKYHPDKNPNCNECEDKFNKIIKAWQVIGSPEKRKHYDANSGFITQIKSQSISLTPQNYENSVEGSKSLWMIQVYDSTQKYCHYFSQFWEDIVKQYGDYIKFGRVDVWTQTNMLSYMPYKFQVFPSIYFYHKGEIEVCPFDFQQPDMSVRRCIQNQYKQNLIISIDNIENIPLGSKPSIIFNQQIKVGSRFKIINKKYQEDFNFYVIPTINSTINQGQKIVGILPNNQQIIFQVNSKNPQYYKKYENFLESLIVQKISICEFISICENQPCFILLNKQQNWTLPKQQPNQANPVYVIEDLEFSNALENLKNKTKMFENFDLGLYKNGHIDLGYLNQASILNAQEGQSFQQLHCIHKDVSLIGRIVTFLIGLKQYF